MLSEVSLGIKSNDQACIWLAAEFVASGAYFSGSGYIKAGMARRLKGAVLDEQIKTLLRRGIAKQWATGAFRQEWREFSRLLQAVGVGSEAPAFQAAFKKSHANVRARFAPALGFADVA